jgi:hypothetical protein
LKLQTKNSQAKEAEVTALNALKNFVNKTVSAQQLQDAKDNIIGGSSLKTASNDNILIYLSIIGFYDLPLDFLSSFTDATLHLLPPTLKVISLSVSIKRLKAFCTSCARMSLILSIKLLKKSKGKS